TSPIPVRTALPERLEGSTLPQLEQRQHPLLDPQFTCATGLVTLDSLKEKIKELADMLEPLIKTELRKTRQSSMAEFIIEHDLRTIIIRAGLAGDSVSLYAAHVYLEIFRILHPRTHAGWTVEIAHDFLQKLIVKDRDTYFGTLKSPRVLDIVQRMDAIHGTGITKPTRDILLITAFFAASVNGKVSQEKATEIGRMQEVFQAGPSSFSA
ncbi:MAG: hypothetical protein WBL61_08170, partial [Bryobacteraceae bacterium]